jgi:hypothetical protein
MSLNVCKNLPNNMLAEIEVSPVLQGSITVTVTVQDAAGFKL